MHDEQEVLDFSSQVRAPWNQRALEAIKRVVGEAREAAKGGPLPRPDVLVRLDLSGLTEGEPDLLTRVLREAAHWSLKIRRRRKRGEPSAAICLKWIARSRSERTLRSAVQWRWELLDRDNAHARVSLPLIMEDDRKAVLGFLPSSLAGERLIRLASNRLVTYHTLAIDRASPGHTPKALGKLLSGYERLGLLIKRSHLSRDELRALHPAMEDFPVGNVRAWESVLAAAGGKTGTPIQSR